MGRKLLGALVGVVLVVFAAGTAYAAFGHARTAWLLADAAWLGEPGDIEIIGCEPLDGDVGTRPCRGRFVAAHSRLVIPTVRVDLPAKGPHDPGTRVPAVVGGPDATRAYPAGGPNAFTVAVQLALAVLIAMTAFACAWSAHRLTREARIWVRDRWRRVRS